jgi:hypothetical protein
MHRKTEEDPAPNLRVAESDFSKPAEGQKKTTTGCLMRMFSVSRRARSRIIEYIVDDVIRSLM